MFHVHLRRMCILLMLDRLFCVCLFGIFGLCMLTHFSHVWLLLNLWTIACQDPLSMGFSSQEYWSGLPCPLPGDLPDQASNSCLLCLLHWQMSLLALVPAGKPLLVYIWLKFAVSLLILSRWPIHCWEWGIKVLFISSFRSISFCFMKFSFPTLGT